MESKPLCLARFLSSVALISCSAILLAQVPTRFIDKTDKTPVEELIPGSIEDKVPAQKILPVPDVQRAITEHERQGRGTYFINLKTNELSH